MVVSFNWFSYSVIIGFLKRGAGTSAIQDAPGSGISGAAKSGVREFERRTFEPGESERKKSERGEDLFQLADRIKKELRLCIRQSAIKKQGKQELLLSLRRLIRPYPLLKVLEAHPFRVAINNVIEGEAEKYCSIHLTREDLLILWQDRG